MLYFRQFRFDLVTSCLYCEAEHIPLRPKVAQLLSYFLCHPNQIVTREALLSTLWQHGEYREAALTQSITELRQALKDSAQQPIFIKTVPQQGYHWICPLEERTVLTAIGAGKRKRIAAALCIALFGGLVTHQILSHYSEQNETARQTQLIILPLQNETGVEANVWWGYALEAALREQLQEHVHLVPKSQYPELGASTQVSKLTLKLIPLQQRFILQASLGHEQQQVIVEQLDEQFSAIAAQLIARLKLVEPGEFQQDPKLNAGMNDYFRGLQALTEQGPTLAKRYFEAALLQMPGHVPTQLELAQLNWQLGDIEQARQDFVTMDPTSSSFPTQARYFLYYGEFLKALGEFTEALTQADKALVLAQQSQQVELIAMAYQQQADLFWALQRWEEYQQAMNAAHTLIGSRSFAYSEAQRSFYLANPPAAGPMEKTLLNLQDSKPVLEQAIAYYQKNNQKMALIQALFAYGQNYLVPVSITEPSLLRALDLAREGGYAYLEQQIRTYLGFYYIQLHQGQKALEYVEQKAIDPRFAPQYEQQQLLIAMAYMDIALQGDSEEAQARAIAAYQALLASDYLSPITRANVTLLLAWTWLKADNIALAEQLTQAALLAYQQLQLGEVETYAHYTQMYIQLIKGEPKQALDIMPPHSESQLVLLYGAVAAELSQAEPLKQQLKTQLAELNNSSALLTQLQQVELQGTHSAQSIIALIDAPYSVYCQSKWTIN